MRIVRLALPSLFLLALAVPALAQNRGGFVVQLGTDTTSVESYVRTGDKLEVEQVGRSPRTMRRRYVYDLKNGMPEKFSMVVTPPGAAAPTQTIESVIDGDTLRSDIKAGANSQKQAVRVAKGTLLAAASAPWSQYELLTLKLAKARGDTVGAPLYFIGAGSTNWITAKRAGRDSVELRIDRGDVYRARVDKSGQILGVRPIAGPQQFSATRVPVDVGAYAASYMAREQAGSGMGVLSPRDSVKIAIGGANVAVDYGRPAKRGRVVFGGLVPYGEVWRTGANGATGFRTDRDLVIQGQTVPAGYYTIWTVPTATGWKLMLNSQTGQWGTEHDASKDVFTFDMKTEPQTTVTERFTIAIDPAEGGGVLRMDWDTTRATLPFTVKS